MADTEPHPHPKFEWGCPDCGSADVAKHHDTAGWRAASPPYSCRECGVRFYSTVEVRADA